MTLVAQSKPVKPNDLLFHDATVRRSLLSLSAGVEWKMFFCEMAAKVSRIQEHSTQKEWPVAVRWV